MKKQILIQIIIIILSAFVLLLGCSYSKQNKSIENIDVNTIMPGKYIGESYNITSSFIPVLSFDNNNKFIFELGINYTIEGRYTIDNNKLVLNTNGGESYTLEITEHSLKIEQEIPNVKRNTKFKLLE